MERSPSCTLAQRDAGSQIDVLAKRDLVLQHAMRANQGPRADDDSRADHSQSADVGVGSIRALSATIAVG